MSVGSRKQKEGQVRWGGVVLARGLRQSCLPRPAISFHFRCISPAILHPSGIRYGVLPSAQERVRFLFCLLVLFLDVSGYYYQLLLPAYHGLYTSIFVIGSRGYHTNDPNMFCTRLCKQEYTSQMPQFMLRSQLITPRNIPSIIRIPSRVFHSEPLLKQLVSGQNLIKDELVLQVNFIMDASPARSRAPPCIVDIWVAQYSPWIAPVCPVDTGRHVLLLTGGDHSYPFRGPVAVPASQHRLASCDST